MTNITDVQDAQAFKSRRRRIVQQVLFNKALPPRARVLGYTIAADLNKDSESTCPSDFTLKQKSGISLGSSWNRVGEFLARRLTNPCGV